MPRCLLFTGPPDWLDHLLVTVPRELILRLLPHRLRWRKANPAPPRPPPEQRLRPLSVSFSGSPNHPAWSARPAPAAWFPFRCLRSRHLYGPRSLPCHLHLSLQIPSTAGTPGLPALPQPACSCPSWLLRSPLRAPATPHCLRTSPANRTGSSRSNPSH